MTQLKKGIEQSTSCDFTSSSSKIGNEPLQIPKLVFNKKNCMNFGETCKRCLGFVWKISLEKLLANFLMDGTTL